MSQVTVKELDELIEKLDIEEKKKETVAETLTGINKEINALEYRIAAYLNELGRDEYVCPIGKFTIKDTWRVNMPQTDMDKRMLFDHLRERGIFDKLATVNSNSLNALYRADWEEAKERGEGMTFAMPGVPAPKFDKKLDFKPAKKQ